MIGAARAGQHETHVAPHISDRAPVRESGAERAFGLVRIAAMMPDDREVVPGERVIGIQVERLTIRAFGIIELARLVARDTKLIPELGAVRLLLHEVFVESGGR